MRHILHNKDLLVNLGLPRRKKLKETEHFMTRGAGIYGANERGLQDNLYIFLSPALSSPGVLKLKSSLQGIRISKRSNENDRTAVLSTFFKVNCLKTRLGRKGVRTNKKVILVIRVKKFLRSPGLDLH